MIVKIHETKNGTIVAVVDSELIGKTFEEGDFQIDLTSNFYKGEEMPIEKIGDLIRNAYGLNLVGKDAIKLAVEEGLLDETMIKSISKIPYYQGTFDVF